MKTYFRILQFARPVGKFALPYFFLSILGMLFGILNITLLIPLFDMIIGKKTEAQMTAYLEVPEFSLSVDYFIDLFNHQLAQVVVQYGRLEALQFVSLTIVVSVLLTNLFNYFAIRILEYLRVHTISNVRKSLYQKITDLHVGYFTNTRKGDIVSRVTNDAYELESSIADSFKGFLKEPITMLGFFVGMFVISVKLTIFTLIVIPLAGALIAWIIKKLKQDAVASQESLGRLLTIIDETLGGIRIVKGFNAEKHLNKRFQTENDIYGRNIRSMAYKRELASPVSEFMGVLVVAGIMLYGGTLVINEDSSLTASQFLAYIALFSQVLRPAKAITTAISRVQRGLVASERVLELLDTPVDILEKPDAKAFPDFKQHIRFENVSFAYEDTLVLKDIDLEIPRGKVVALVGQSGSGKSTLADLIPRFYDVGEGKILIDGVDIREYSIHSLRKKMGIVTQESILFNDTIFNNIAFATPNADREAVVQAAKVANAHEFIMEMEKGYDTVIGDRGAKLSGGQRQRVSIARAVFKNPPIMILDEATSALDTESEKLVQEALENLMKNRTTLVIAHRLSTIQNADEILVVDKGRIVERGVHAELIKQENGIYRKLNELQAIET